MLPLEASAGILVLSRQLFFCIYSVPRKKRSHLKCRLLSSVRRIIGTGIFSTPSSITESVGSVGAAFVLWLLGFLLSLAGLFVWLEFGCMFPRSGGEKVYPEAAYRRPRSLATVVFASYTVLLGFTGKRKI